MTSKPMDAMEKMMWFQIGLVSSKAILNDTIITNPNVPDAQLWMRLLSNTAPDIAEPIPISKMVQGIIKWVL